MNKPITDIVPRVREVNKIIADCSSGIMPFEQAFVTCPVLLRLSGHQRDYRRGGSYGLGVDEKNYPLISVVIKEAMAQGLIKVGTPEGTNRRDIAYIPHWG